MRSDRTISRFAFKMLVLFSFVAISLIEGLLIAVISQRLGFARSSDSGLFVVLFVFNFMVSPMVVDGALKAIGLSRSGRIVEGRRPAEMTAQWKPTEDAIEVRCSRSQSTALASMCLGLVVLIVVTIEVIVPKHQQEGRELLFLLYAMLLGIAAYAYLMRYIKIIGIDPLGVTAARTQYSIRRTTIPWSQIASCDFVVVRDTLGTIALAYPVVKDATGKDLFPALATNMTMATPEDQHKVLRYLKGRFSKLDLDPWDL
jgi:hypothetical protein